MLHYVYKYDYLGVEKECGLDLEDYVKELHNQANRKLYLIFYGTNCLKICKQNQK